MTGERNKSPTLAKAISEFVGRRRARELGRLIRESGFDDPAAAQGEGTADPANSRLAPRRRQGVADMVLVDPSTRIEAGRQDTATSGPKLAVEGLLEAYKAQWCAPVRLEILGCARKEERHSLGIRFSVILYRSCTEDDGERAITLAWKLRNAGSHRPVARCSCQRHSIALHDAKRVYAVDKHFSAITRILPIRLYQPDCGGTDQDV